MSKWQPMETAPLDGTVILIARMRLPDTPGWVHVAYWGRFEGGGGTRDYPWICIKEKGRTGRWGGMSPTHWMPLPNPPIKPVHGRAMTAWLKAEKANV